jgi:hypothetical protein
MLATARTPDRLIEPPRPDGQVSPDSAAAWQLPSPVGRAWPADAQVRGLTGTVVLSGYGPAASSFV